MTMSHPRRGSPTALSSTAASLASLLLLLSGAAAGGCQKHLVQLPVDYDDDESTDDDDTTGVPGDADGDGYSPDDGDCNDANAEIHPGADDDCDAVDWDCDGNALECASCAAVLEAVAQAPDDVYEIDPDGDGGADPVLVQCLMSVDGGGWTEVMRTTDDWDDTSALLTDYATFHGSSVGIHDGAFRLAGMLWPMLDEAGEVLVEIRIRLADGGACDPLYYKATGVTFEAPTEGPATATGYVQGITVFSAAELSTTDGGPATTCVNDYDAVPWFYGNCCAICPTYGGVYFDPPSPMTSSLAESSDLLGHTSVDVCTGAADESYGKSGATSITYFSR